MSQAGLALASAVGTSVLTILGWQSSSWVAPTGPLCRAAAALLDQALTQRSSQTGETPCICDAEQRIETLLLNLTKPGEEELEGVDAPLRVWVIELCRFGPWLIESVIALPVGLCFGAQRVLCGAGAAPAGEDSLPPVRAVRRRRP